MKKAFISLILLFLTPLHSFIFKDIFLQGKCGDYSIYQNGTSVTILSIHSKEIPYITFEEITLTKKTYHNIKGKDLNTWIKRGAKGSTSWTLMEINTDSMDVTSAYCFLKKAHLDISKEDTLISSLLNLNINKVPDTERLRIGPRGLNKKDSRSFWVPSMIVDGKIKSPSIVDVYGGSWEKDSSPLSGKEIDLYILDNFPFPYWIQIHGDLGSRKMISLDSGSNLLSFIKEIPKTPPVFLSKLEIWDNDKENFSFLVKGGRKLTDFTTYLVEVAKDSNKLIPIESKYKNIDTCVLKFNFLRKRLAKELTVGKTYRLYLSYNDEGEIHSIISKDIIHWK